MALPEHTQVLIVGAGPVGLVLAHLLGTEGVETLLVERNAGCVPEPRAISIDGESLRTLQAAGVVEEVRPDLLEGFVADYVNGDGTHLFSTDLRERPFGFCMQNAFDQPRLERTLLATLAPKSSVTVRHETELQSFEQHAEGVDVRLRDADGKAQRVHADYLVGCDGGRSEIRRAIGAVMEGDRLPEKWLVVDTVAPEDDELPTCRFFCDPARPAMTLKRPHGERRWEWMLMPGETDADLLEDARIRALLAEHTNPDGIGVYRKCVYGFSAVVADRFSAGRVFLAGDAAHMTPPFAGQGLNSGLRDARNLSWKLAAVLAGRLPATLLGTYQTERHDGARMLVDLAVGLGARIQPTDPAAAAERDAMFAAINADPRKAAEFRANSAAALRSSRLPGGWFDAETGGGAQPWQPTLEGAVGRLDDVIGRGFAVLRCGGAGVGDVLAAHPLWRALDPKQLDLDAFGAAASELGPDVDAHTPGLLLLRPDRFVLARLPADEAGALAALDRLHAAL
ncbi:MAG: bifunctional 3-(3-hydroxy-phenyl)propionate/3-hydroxycinnamic acid hydroxylase [Pseudomonadales bacterium]|jgi:3-(3-hydroxy-phenyl)propionate hydroxylase|nr:bifunctional 3-(3-hydroxy-phenyl)propionate/3-hydroxycinnamic acid hydroxylase [Pseudomonadales bacterium]